MTLSNYILYVTTIPNSVWGCGIDSSVSGYEHRWTLVNRVMKLWASQEDYSFSRRGYTALLIATITKLPSQCTTQTDTIQLKNKNQPDANYYFIVLLIGSTCFSHYYVHHQELATIMFITTLVFSFCKDGGGSVNVKLWFLVMYIQCEVLCRLVVAGYVFLLILIVVILYAWR